MSLVEEVPASEKEAFFHFLQSEEFLNHRNGLPPLQAYLKSEAHQKALEELRFKPKQYNVSEANKNHKIGEY